MAGIEIRRSGLRKRFWAWFLLVMLSCGSFGYYKWSLQYVSEILDAHVTQVETSYSIVHPVAVWPKLIDVYADASGRSSHAEIRKFLIYTLFGLLLVSFLGFMCGAAYSFIEIARWRRWGRFRDNPDLEI